MAPLFSLAHRWGLRTRVGLHSRYSSTSSSTAVQLRELQPASRQPLVYLLDNFLTDAECDHLVSIFWGLRSEHVDPDSIDMLEWWPEQAHDPVAHEVERRVGALMGSPPHALDGGVKIERKAAAPAAGAPAAGAPAAAEGFRHVADGMHIDTHKASQRWATCLIYLTTLDEGDGGATVFPLAGDSTPDALVADARFLAGSECTHTDIASHGQESDRGERSPLVTAARRLVDAGEAAAEGEIGLRVQPRKGTAAIFFTRREDGLIDPRSFHFGASVRARYKEKCTVQIFKALPEAARGGEHEAAAFMRRVHPFGD